MELTVIVSMLLLSPLLTDAAITNVFVYSQLPKCGHRMEYRMIPDSCEPSCDRPQPGCITRDASHRVSELPTCRCKSGFFRSVDGSCLSLSECMEDITLRKKRDISKDGQDISSVDRVKRQDRSDGVDYSSLPEGSHTPLQTIVAPMQLLFQWPQYVRALFAARF